MTTLSIFDIRFDLHARLLYAHAMLVPNRHYLYYTHIYNINSYSFRICFVKEETVGQVIIIRTAQSTDIQNDHLIAGGKFSSHTPQRANLLNTLMCNYKSFNVVL